MDKLQTEFDELPLGDYKTVFEESTFGICTVDASLHCIRANHKILTTYGSDNFRVGDSINDVFPHLAPEMVAPISVVLNSGKSVTSYEFSPNSFEREQQVRLRGDFVPVFDQHSNVAGVSCILLDISDLAAKEKQLRLTQFSVDTSQTMIFWINRDASFFYVNDAAANRFGYSKEELCSMKVSDIDPDYTLDVWPHFWSNVRREKSLTFESNIRCKKGQLVPVEITTNYLEFEGDEFVFAFVLDISDRKKTINALVESEELFRNVVNTAKFGIQCCNLDGQITFANPSLGEIYECDSSELIGKYVWELTDSEEEQVGIKERAEKDANKKQIPGTFRTRNTTLKGREIFVHIDWTYDRNSDGEIVGFVVIVSDVTEKVRNQEKLITSEARFRALVENNNDVFNLFDDKGELIYTSPAVKKVLGYEPAEMCAMTPEQILHPDDFEAASNAFFEHASRPGSTGNFIHRLKHKNGSYRTVEVTGRNLLHEPGINAMFSVFRDVTERVKANLALRERESQLAHVARLCTLGEVAAGIAHELRQPMCAIENFANAIKNLLNEKQDISELESLKSEIMQCATDIGSANQMASEIIAGIFNYSRIADAGLAYEDVEELVEESIELTSFESRKNFVQIGIAKSRPEVSVKCNRIQVQQVLVNLIMNACQAFQKAESDQPRVEICWQVENEIVELSVSDNGVGLPDEIKDNLFAPFSTTKPKGMGMGLAICRTIIDSHGGVIWAHSEPGEGTRFYFALPLHGDSQEGLGPKNDAAS